MSIEANDYNDNSILNATSRERTPNGFVVFSIMLPSGRKLTSDGVREEDSARAAVTWCEAVRGQIQHDMEEERAEKRRARTAFDTAPETVDTPAPTQTAASTHVPGVGEIVDPEAMIRRTVANLDAQIEGYEATINLTTARHAEAVASRGKWAAIAEGLGIELESDDDDSSSEEESGEAGSEPDSTGSDSPVRTGGSGKRRTRRSRSKGGNAGNSKG
jgi:hypothetical protein